MHYDGVFRRAKDPRATWTRQNTLSPNTNASCSSHHERICSGNCTSWFASIKRWVQQRNKTKQIPSGPPRAISHNRKCQLKSKQHWRSPLENKDVYWRSDTGPVCWAPLLLSTRLKRKCRDDIVNNLMRHSGNKKRRGASTNTANYKEEGRNKVERGCNTKASHPSSRVLPSHQHHDWLK